MSTVSMRQMLEAGVHFGHQARFWNPKMAPFIFGERSKIHIINLEKTLPLYEEALNFIGKLVANKGTLLFVGTKRSARDTIRGEAQRCKMPYVNHRWLGGMLTNFPTIHKRILYMHELDRMEASGEMEALPKKERLRLRRELGKLKAVLGGVGGLSRPPNAVFIIDIRNEEIAVKEARRLRIPIVAVVDTNCDPDLVDHIIPGNDDAIRAAQLLASVMADACVEGRELAEARGKDRPDDEAPPAGDD